MSKTYLVSATYKQASVYALEHNLRLGEWSYVYREEHLMGIYDGKFVLLPGYENLAEAKRLKMRVDVIHARQQSERN